MKQRSSVRWQPVHIVQEWIFICLIMQKKWRILWMKGESDRWKQNRSEQLFKKAVKLIPGGVNSPVRAFGSVGMTPRFIASAEGAYHDGCGWQHVIWIM